MIKHSPDMYEHINEKLKGKRATVRLVQGQKYRVANITIKADSTSWLDVGTCDYYGVPTFELESVEIDRSRAGYGIALVIILAGGLGGSLAASKIMTDEDRNEMTGLAAFAVGGLCLGLGILLSLPVIFFTISKDKYVFEHKGAPFLFNRYPSQIIIFSDRIGESIEQEEYNRFQLEYTFLKTKGFQSATLLKLYDGKEYFRIIYHKNKLAEPEERWILISDHLKKQIIEYIDQSK
jgi:hypothetical protein